MTRYWLVRDDRGDGMGEVYYRRTYTLPGLGSGLVLCGRADAPTFTARECSRLLRSPALRGRGFYRRKLPSEEQS